MAESVGWNCIPLRYSVIMSLPPILCLLDSLAAGISRSEDLQFILPRILAWLLLAMTWLGSISWMCFLTKITLWTTGACEYCMLVAVALATGGAQWGIRFLAGQLRDFAIQNFAFATVGLLGLNVLCFATLYALHFSRTSRFKQSVLAPAADKRIGGDVDNDDCFDDVGVEEHHKPDF